MTSGVQVKARRLKDLKKAYDAPFTVEFPISDGLFRGQIIIHRKWTNLIRKGKPELRIATSDLTALDAVGKIKIIKKEGGK
jgi:hypothetical protein